ncbi:DUF4190 domain-containing protein [Metabacillus malikii]|uniref:DUF4190 domain-containing protein n=1 Tax=Metabacillus malikii TaxID=1504265 RepID=A0ABT9ZH65_9BACI|nr:DUF4190 domain-containing protein [Metabacillus malikii]MDQ0231625.1 hypothetical protein [Metabacillus malikii]
MPEDKNVSNQGNDRFDNLDYKGITPLDREIESDFSTESANEVSAPVNNVNDGENNNTNNMHTESAAEIAAPVNLRREVIRNKSDSNMGESTATEGKGIGFLALALSIISLFILPVILGAAGVIVGFIARRRGATGTGAWAIGIGIVSIILGMFIMPFF